MISDDKIIEIFCKIDNFMKEYDKIIDKYGLEESKSKKTRKRAIIESVNDLLKNSCQIEHSRHRSFENFIGNMLSAMVAYSFLPKKPSIKIDRFLPNKAIA